MTAVKITSETADVIADFMCEYQSDLHNKLVAEGFDLEEVSEIMSAYMSINGKLINMLGEESGTSFTIEIK
jgi:hypothetical protein